MSPVTPRIRILFLALACYAGLFFGSANLPFVGADEPRYSRVAFEMLTSGDWVIPHLEGRPWLEKPPLYYWSTAILYRLVGAGEAQARLTSGLAILGLVGSVFLFGRRWFSPQVGWLAAAMLAGSIASMAFAHAASMDALFSFLLFLGLAAGFDALYIAGRGSIFRWLLSAVALAGAVLAKGMLGLVLPIGIFAIFLVWEEGWRRLSWSWLVLWLTVFLVLAVPWHLLAYQRAGFDFLAIYMVNHHLARFFTEIHHHTQPFYYYLPVLIAGLLPWSALLPLLWRTAVPQSKAGTVASAARHLLWWTGGLVVGFFSISASKLPGYILPVIAPLILLIADRLSCWVEDPVERRRRIRRAALALGTLLVLLGLAAAWGLALRYRLPAAQTTAVGLALGLGAVALFRLAGSKKPEVELVVAITAGAQAVMVVVLSLFCLNQIGWYHSTREIVQAGVNPTIKAEDHLASYRYFHHSIAYYSGYRYEGNLEHADAVRDKLNSIGPGSLYLVTEPGWFSELQRAFPEPQYRLDLLASRGPLRLARLTLLKPLQ